MAVAIFILIYFVVGLALFVTVFKAPNYWLSGAAVVGLVIMGFAYARLRVALALRPLLNRADQRSRWLKDFGEENEKAVERFLELFCETFDLPQRAKFKLAPDEEIDDYEWEHYRSAKAGETEREVFFTRLEEEFHVKLPRDFAPSVELQRILKLVLKKPEPADAAAEAKDSGATG